MTYPPQIAEWTILRELPRPERQGCRGRYFLCQCSCGVQSVLTESKLRNTKSCGHKRELPKELIQRAAEHGITAKQVYDRLAKGWDDHRASTQKIGTVRRKR